MVLTSEQRSKLDGSSDALFYEIPRFVTHVDDHFIDLLRNLYRQYLQPYMRIVDLMSSWVSHLPDDLSFEWVEGHGMNAEELARNPRLNHYFIQDLNQNLQLPLPDKSFDAILNTASIQYLQYPEAIFAEIFRVLKPQGIAIVSFSNRMFYQKAVQIWRDGSEAERVQLVQSYFAQIEGFDKPDIVIHRSSAAPILQMLGLGGGDPFYAVIAKVRDV